MPEAAQTFLVVVDETPECAKALRLAAMRARRTGGSVALLHVIRPAQFVQWGRVQQAIEAEAEEAASLILEEAARTVEALLGKRPAVSIRRGKPAEQVLAQLTEDPAIRALVLAAAASGRPGPLINFFAGERAGSLPCLVIVVPGSMTDEALDRLA
jgi:nucleotide-binding universal stress UspA family protein